MSHPEQQAFIGAIKNGFPEFFGGGRVLEIGSLNINGSVRQHFAAKEYIGLDVGEGPGVDIVCEGQNYDAPDNSFDVVISAECLEHNPHWVATFNNMFRLCRPGGLVIMTCAGPGRKEHGTRRTTPQDAPLIPWDYYKNIGWNDIMTKVMPDRKSSSYLLTSHFSSHDTYFAGFKIGAAPPAKAKREFKKIAAFYRHANRSIRAFKEGLLIGIFGEERYMAGSLIPWKRTAA